MTIKEPWNAVPPSSERRRQDDDDARQGVQGEPRAKSRIAAGVLAIFLPGFGAHKFYLGYRKEGAIILAASILGGILTGGIVSWAVGVVGMAEGIMYLVRSDAEFQRIYVLGRRRWF